MSIEPNQGTKQVVRRNAWLATTIAMLGGLLIIASVVRVDPVAFIMGGVIVCLACLLDRRQHLCGFCGNPVVKESKLCPVCGAQFID